MPCASTTRPRVTLTRAEVVVAVEDVADLVVDAAVGDVVVDVAVDSEAVVAAVVAVDVGEDAVAVTPDGVDAAVVVVPGRAPSPPAQAPRSPSTKRALRVPKRDEASTPLSMLFSRIISPIPSSTCHILPRSSRLCS